MRKKMMRWVMIFALAGSGFGCAGFDTLSRSMFMMSTEQEVQLGKQVQAEVDKQYRSVADPMVNGYVQSIGQRLVASSPQQPPVPASFHVVANKEINAFAIPGGDVYVQTGLIDAADDEAELAAVMAHELGHVIYRHSAAAVSRQTGMELLQQVVLGSQSPQAAQIVGNLFGQGVMFRYSRADEAQADAIGVEILARSGYDPLAMKTFFTKLANKYGGGSGNPVTKLFSSHPPTNERMAAVEQHAAGLRAQYPDANRRPLTELRRAQSRIEQLGLGTPGE